MATPSKNAKPDLASLLKRGLAPATWSTPEVKLTGVYSPQGLPSEIQCHTFEWKNSPLEELPPGLRVVHKLDLTGSTNLERLPENLSVSVLILADCPKLTSLPEGLRCDFLTISGCRSLRHWPASAKVTIGGVNARNCVSLRKLPPGLGPLNNLNLSGCGLMESLPADLAVSSWVDLGGTKITSLPAALTGVGLRWNSVAVNAQVAFFPETLTAGEALSERNAEVRRVMIERMGFERFMAEAKAVVLNEDTDPGGPRKLLMVTLDNDEPLVVVSVRCPSTGRAYLIRVPPTMKTCRQAVAWTAGFDNEKDYIPVAET